MPDKGCFDCRFKTPRLIEAADEMTGHLERLVQFIESGGEDASFIKDILARYYAERKKFGPKEEDQEVFDSFSYGEVPVIVMTKEEIEARFGKKEEDTISPEERDRGLIIKKEVPGGKSGQGSVHVWD